MFERPFVQHCVNNNIDIYHRDIYTFGVYTGSSMIRLQLECQRAGKIPDRFFGFDSFVGLPKEQDGIEVLDIHHEGQYSAEKDTGLDTNSVIEQIRKELVYSDRTHFISGYYCDCLTDNLFEEMNFKPAAYIEMDVDLYVSAKEALFYMAKKNLIAPGTVIYYDDWGGIEEWTAGESLAHKEICEEFLITCKRIHDLGDGKPHRSVAYIVDSIGK